MLPSEIWALIAGYLTAPWRLFQCCRQTNRSSLTAQLPIGLSARSPTIKEVIRWFITTNPQNTENCFLTAGDISLQISVRWSGDSFDLTFENNGHQLLIKNGLRGEIDLNTVVDLNTNMLTIYREIVLTRRGCRYDLDQLILTEVERQSVLSYRLHELKAVVGTLPLAVSRLISSRTTQLFETKICIGCHCEHRSTPPTKATPPTTKAGQLIRDMLADERRQKRNNRRQQKLQWDR